MGLLSVVLSALVFLVSVAYLYIRKRHQYWRDHGFPYMANPSLLNGHMKGAITTFHACHINRTLYEQLKGRGERYGGYSFFILPAVLVVDADIVKTILVKDFNMFHDRNMFNNAKVDPLSANLFALEGNPWRVLRQKLTPTFTSGKMKQMFGTIQVVAKEFQQHMHEQVQQTAEIEMKEVLVRFTTDVIGTIAFGIECNTLRNPNSDFLKFGNKIFQQSNFTLMKITFAMMFKDAALKIGLRVTENDVEEFFMSIVKETVDYREKNNIQRDDFMNLLLQIKNHGQISDDLGKTGIDSKGEMGITVNELAAQVFLFFLAGFETSSTTMNFCLYELAKNPDIQERLRGEIKKAIEENDGNVTYDLTMSLPYLDHVVSETLRKYPPFESLSRIATQNYTIPGTNHVIPKGFLVQIPVYALHHDPEHYPNPERFNPDRFLPEEVAKRHPYVYLPFGEGPRNCIAMRFGLMQTKIGLITLLTNFRFSPTARTPEAIRFAPKIFVLTPDSGNYLKVEKLQ